PRSRRRSRDNPPPRTLAGFRDRLTIAFRCRTIIAANQRTGPLSEFAVHRSTSIGVRLKTDIVVIGAGQAGLSSAYHLSKRGLAPNRGFIVLDRSPAPGGAWQFRWPSLTLSTVNRIHDLPGMRFADAVDTSASEVQASLAVPRYFAAYEQEFGIP